MNPHGEDRLLERIDAELRDALDVRPSPELAARIRRRVQEQPSRGFLPGWLIPVAAAALAVAVGVALLPTKGRREAPAMTAPAEARLVPPAVEPSVPQAAELAPAVARIPAPLPVVRPRPVEPEVLVPAGQEEAIQRYAAQMRNLRVGGAVLPEEGRELAVAPLQTVMALELTPLVSDPETEGVKHD